MYFNSISIAFRWIFNSISIHFKRNFDSISIGFKKNSNWFRGSGFRVQGLGVQGSKLKV